MKKIFRYLFQTFDAESYMLTTLQRSRRIRRQVLASLASVVVVSVMGSLSSGTAQEAVRRLTQQAASSKSEGETGLIREGSRISNRPAVCRSSGERLLVSIEEVTSPLIALENLAAQRILQAVLDDVADDHWIVGGQITEFQDRNYILLDRVIRQPKSN